MSSTLLHDALKSALDALSNHNSPTGSTVSSMFSWPTGPATPRQHHDEREKQYEILEATVESTDWQSMSVDDIMNHKAIDLIHWHHNQAKTKYFDQKQAALKNWLTWGRNCKIEKKKPKIYKGYRGVFLEGLPGSLSLDLGIEITDGKVTVNYNQSADFMTPNYIHEGDESIRSGYTCSLPKELSDKNRHWYMDGLYCRIVWMANRDKFDKMNEELLKLREEVLAKREEYHAEFMAKNKGHKSVTKQLAVFIHKNQMADIEPEAFITVLNWLAKYEDLAKPLARWASTHHSAVQLMTPENVEEAIKIAQIQSVQEA